MAEIISNEKKGGSTIQRKKSVHLDMTPMVDLAFLLLTFFVLAATLAKPKAMEIIYPQEGGVKSPLNEDDAITLLLGNSPEKTAYYFGSFNDEKTNLVATNLSSHGIRPLLMSRNAYSLSALATLNADRESGEVSEEIYREQYLAILSNKKMPFVIIKTRPDTKYDRIISALDELEIACIRKRVVQDMEDEEFVLLEKMNANAH
jgi:biopolymer transport protein ExbD